MIFVIALLIAGAIIGIGDILLYSLHLRRGGK